MCTILLEIHPVALSDVLKVLLYYFNDLMANIKTKLYHTTWERRLTEAGPCKENEINKQKEPEECQYG